MPQPTTPKLEIEFTAGVWTDVTADTNEFDIGPVTMTFGRSSPFSQPQPGTFSCVLDNTLGKYTANRQVLTDGVTTHPFWPNIQPLKRVRYSYVAGSQQIRFLGYIRQWQPYVTPAARQAVIINAVDRLDRMGRASMLSPLMTETLADTPEVFWPLTDGVVNSGPQLALDASGNSRPSMSVLFGTQQALNFGDNGPGYGDGSGVKFAPTSATAGQYLGAFGITGLNLAAFTFEVWVNCGTQLPAWVTGSKVETIFGIVRRSDGAFAGSIGVTATGRPFFRSTTTVNGPASIVDGGWHHIAVTRSTNGGSCTLWVDGANCGANVSSAAVTDMDQVILAEGAANNTRFQGNIGYVAVYDYALTPTRIAAHANAGNGYYGDTTNTRLQRYLGIAGLTNTDWNLDTGQITLNHYPQAGKDVTSAGQDLSASEGGGSAFYVLPSGLVRFANRRYRDNRTPAITIDADADMDGSGWQPALDSLELDAGGNKLAANRSAESGSLTSQMWSDPTSIANNGPVTGNDLTTYTTSDADALNLAQWQVSSSSTPRFRAPQVTVDLVSAVNNLYASLATVQIGSRLRLTNLPAKAAPWTQIDLFIEGWTETYDGQSYSVKFDVSPVDYRWKWDTSRWGPDAGGAVLNAAITNSATTLAIKTLSGPTWTTNAGMYPLVIQVGEEQIRLNSAPGGSSSPQTYTGVTRGVNGTIAAAQAINAVISLAPDDAWAL